MANMPASKDSYTPCDISSRTACKREGLRHISAYAADEPQRDIKKRTEETQKEKTSQSWMPLEVRSKSPCLLNKIRLPSGVQLLSKENKKEPE
ncbi:hypothetical protein OUZ56_000745 [Daphnia magna]|uniref:Uncharacterized protein n=1 Tax=Daphnia magna TaxID=35525 RepID=A0ABR0A187_9CRUS|nr:hypothetical protein OUZ56_000745 [Daphnia magna]